MSGERMAELLIELGPLLELEAVLEEAADSSWSLVRDEETVLAADLAPLGDKLVLAAPVAPLPAGDGEEVKRRLLAFNHAVEANEGIWMSLDAPRGSIVQSREFPVEGLTLDRLRAGVEGFLAHLKRWRAELDPAAARVVGFPRARPVSSGADSRQDLAIGAVKV